MKTHLFLLESTGEVYDQSQCDDAIHDGDIFVVEKERVVAVMVEAWPVAVTQNIGEFHQLTPEADETKLEVSPYQGETRDYSPSFKTARTIAIQAGWPIT